MLFRSPGFSFLAILCLTLGIGTNAAALGWIEGILVRPYPLVAHQDRCSLLPARLGAAQGFTRSFLSRLSRSRKNSTLFESFIVDSIMGTTLTNGDRAELDRRHGVRELFRRARRSSDSRPRIQTRGRHGTQRASGHSHQLPDVEKSLQRRSRHRRKTQFMNGVQHTIIGVAPEKFHGTFIGISFNFWVPTSMQETFDVTGYKLEDRGARWIEGFAFLKPGVTRQQGEAELSAIAKRLRTIIRKRIAATALRSSRYGKRRSTGQAKFHRHSASPRPSFSSSSSSLVPT